MSDDGGERNRPDSELEPARQLWAGRFQGVLSTHSKAEIGYPFGSVVPYCLDRCGQPILLFSHLAQHCRNLDTDPRCALTIYDETLGDVQKNERLTCLADCSVVPPEDIEVGLRYFRYFPNGRMYFEQLNFRFYRLVPRRFHYNGGFATARWVGTERILRTSSFDQKTETDIASHIETTHSLMLQDRFPKPRESKGAIRVAGIDPWGMDLGESDRLARVVFVGPLPSAAEIDTHLRTLP